MRLTAIAFIACCLSLSAQAKPDNRAALVVERVQLAVYARSCGAAAEDVSAKLLLVRRWLVSQAPRQAEGIDRTMLETVEDFAAVAPRKHSPECAAVLADYRARRLSWWRYLQ